MSESKSYKPSHGGYPGEVATAPEPAPVRGLIVRPDGSKEYVTLPEGAAQYQFLSDTVGGWIEYVFVTYGVHAYCNEEGKINGLPINTLGTRLAGREGIDPLVGTVIFLGDSLNDDGEERSLPEEWLHL